MLNYLLPNLSFLTLCLLFCYMDKLIDKKLISDFFSGKMITGLFGSAILLWGLLSFYRDFNYFVYSFTYNPINVIIKFLIVIYFIICGFSISFKGLGRILFNKNPESQKRYDLFLYRLKSYNEFLAKIAIILIIILVANSFFV